MQIGRLLLKALVAVAMTASAAGGKAGHTMPWGSGRDVERIGLIGRQSQLQICNSAENEHICDSYSTCCTHLQACSGWQQI